MSRILVTGGSGFLGSFVADTLSQRGHEVLIFDRKPSPYLADGQEMRIGEIADGPALAEAVAGCDAVYHLAALADLNTAADRPLEAAEVNVLGTVRMLEAARNAGVGRFLFASTVYVYSRAGGFYRASKQACEAFIQEFERHYGLPYTVLRYGSLYGPRSNETNGVYRLLSRASAGEPLVHTGTPEDTREYIHVEDAARLSADALDPEFENSHLVLTGSQPMRIGDLFTMFSEILGRSLDVEYRNSEGESDGHYRITPYAYQPRVGRKLTPRAHVDMGQGILQLLEEMHESRGLPRTPAPSGKARP